MGPRADLDRCRKSRPPPPGFDPRTVQPVASHYTDWATRALFIYYIWKNEEKCGSIMSLFSRRSLIKQNYRQLYFVAILHIILRALLRKQGVVI